MQFKRDHKAKSIWSISTWTKAKDSITWQEASLLKKFIHYRNWSNMLEAVCASIFLQNKVRCYCDSRKYLTGRAFPVSNNIRLSGFTLPASRKVISTERDHHHRGKQESVQGTSHVKLLSLQKSRLFILWVAFCNLVVPTSNNLCKEQLHKAANYIQQLRHTHTLTCISTKPLFLTSYPL